ncbi:signal peptide peptidase SppA [Paraurantiacibacter namhicola]|uniref:Protease 4 n=1 Tax=Paraurantiacibacter namhicola TaxID=645517 RepID=A0A1C7DB03_9SPHN|nr:signal peptide peptidase SppA [Paraurantiacibacter namhicola]ANU08680.1 Protease 4 [Paraurantiacibacter namhicola]
MSFARKVWHLLVAIKDGLALIFLLLFFALLFAILTNRPNPAAVRDGALLMELDGFVVEEAAAIDPLESLLSGAAPVRQYEARDIVTAIDAAAADERINSLALDLSTFSGGGQVHMQAIGAALDRFRKADKPVYVYAVAYADDAMMLAAHATEVWVDPLGGAVIAGPGGERLYYAGLLDRLNVNARIYRVGTYKSGVEPFLLDGMSPEARENAQALYGSLWTEWVANVKQARPAAQVERVTTEVTPWIEESRGDLAKAALDAGLVDKIGTREEWGERVAETAGEDEWDDMPGAFASTDYDTWLADQDEDLDGKAIGVITIAGPISDGLAGPGEAGAERIVDALDNALNDDLAALVIRVDSPGGTVTGSEAIRRAILRHKAAGIPVVVSMANVAASGGYWVSTPADRIFAEPETITGSIGIYGVVPTFENTLADYGITTDGVRTTPLSGQPDLLAGFTPEADTLLQATTEHGYTQFLTLVAKSRGITMERADELGQGRVWDGGTARQMGLVDQFGDLDSALEWAAEQAELGDDWHPKFLKSDQTGFGAFLSGMGGSMHARQAPSDVFGWFAAREADVTARVWQDLDGLLKTQGLQARCLECPAPPASLPREGNTTGLLGWLAHGARP